jgi:hypothetical protein
VTFTCLLPGRAVTHDLTRARRVGLVARVVAGRRSEVLFLSADVCSGSLMHRSRTSVMDYERSLLHEFGPYFRFILFCPVVEVSGLDSVAGGALSDFHDHLPGLCTHRPSHISESTPVFRSLFSLLHPRTASWWTCRAALPLAIHRPSCHASLLTVASTSE